RPVAAPRPRGARGRLHPGRLHPGAPLRRRPGAGPHPAPRPLPLARPAAAAAVRLGCLFVPLFPLAARLRAEPELAREAAAVVEGQGPAARVVAATRAARRAGVRAGATLAQARAVLPGLVARGRDGEAERAAAEALVEVAAAFSPR